VKCKTHDVDYFTARCPSCISDYFRRFDVWKMVGTMCAECRRVFIGSECFRSHRIKLKNRDPGDPKFRCMTEKEFEDGLYTQLPDGEYIGGRWGIRA
jgi:hypothetical protein